MKPLPSLLLIPHAALLAVTAAVAAAPAAKIFPYRGWSIAVLSDDRALEERYVDAACAHAEASRINTLEFHDYVLPGGIVDQLVRYSALPALAGQPRLTHKGVAVTPADRDRDLARFRRMAAKAKQHGMAVNVWYHVFRDIPEELERTYPEAASLDSGFVWKFVEASLTEFFQRVPEVDRITLISLHETPSILARPGKLSREERLLKLYLTIHQACQRAGKELIVRDFIVTPADYATFWSILDRLPPDVYVMTKDVLADWSHLDLPLNPMMHRYRDRKLIVEFDLYGEWSGRGDLPACYPEYIYRHLREAKALNAMGAVGRLIHDSRPAAELPFPTIFEAPQAVNVFTFARVLGGPIPWFGETEPQWHDNVEAIDRRFWGQWARARYGEKAAVPVVRALTRTSEIEKLTFDLCGISFRLYTWYPTFRCDKPGAAWSQAYSWRNFVDRAQKVGIEMLRDEKRQALALATASLRDIESARADLAADDFALLEKLFRSTLLIIRAYDAALDGYAVVYAHQANPAPASLAAAAERLRQLADEIDQARGAKWYFDLTGEMRVLANEIARGTPPPAPVAASRR